MFCITETNKIIITKGDTATMQVEAYDCEQKKYDIKPNDRVLIKVKKTQNSEPVINKEADADNIITFLPNDTNELDSGLYVYDIQIITENGNIYTIIPLNYFEIEEDVV